MRQWVLIGGLALLAPVSTWGMTLEARVACALELEQAKWRERGAGAAEAAAKAAPEAARAVVERSLARERWLAERGRRIDTRLVQAEIDRMATQSRAPEALRQRFRALGNDPLRVGECMARPQLVERLWIEAGRPPVNGRVESVEALGAGELRLPSAIEGTSSPLPNTWRAGGGSAKPRSNHAAIWTGSEIVMLGGAASGVPPQAFDPATDSWRDLPSAGVPPVDSTTSVVWTGTDVLVWGGRQGAVSNAGARWAPGDTAWTPLASTGAPSARRDHSGVWSGQALIVWGGRDGGGASLQDGAAYDPSTDAWTPLATLSAPAPRYAHAAVWAGDRMLIWGGADGGQSGAAYDPVADAWTALPEVDAPVARVRPLHVWTGTDWIVGDSDVDGAARFNPIANSWTPVAAPATPFTSLGWAWTGAAVFAWGYDPLEFAPAAIAAGYAPDLDAWDVLDVAGSPPLMAGASVTAAAGDVVIWGGEPIDLSGSATAIGGRWDGAAWSVLGTGATGEPSPRFDHTAVWTGAEMVVWGGAEGEPAAANALGDGGAYDPATDSWRAIAALGAPTARAGHAAVWTGTEVVVWGGAGVGGDLADGGAYDPAGDTWRTLSPTGAPTARAGHHAVWSGSEVLIVGGGQNGGRYRPDLDTWAPMAEGPDPGEGASVLWAGDRLIAWGGDPFWSAQWLPDGGNGVDLWQGPLTSSEPSPRRGHAAIWTGEEMVIAGGVGVGQPLDASIWRYRPGSGWISQGGFWTSLSAPAVWTGSELVAWGGLDQTGVGMAIDGLRQNVLAAFDHGVTSDGAPMLRHRHSLVWTGSEAIVWGGADENGVALTGLGAYTPASLESLVAIAGIAPPAGQEIGLDYTVTISVDGVAPPLGGVVVIDDGAAAGNIAECTIVLPATQCTLASDEPGTRAVRARFSGDDLHAGSSDTAPYTLARAATQTAIFATDPIGPLLVGEPYDVYASVVGRFTVSGEVSIEDGDGASCTFDVQLGGSRCTLTSTTAGTKTLTATYGGDALNAPSVGTVEVEVVLAPLPDAIFEDGFELIAAPGAVAD